GTLTSIYYTQDSGSGVIQYGTMVYASDGYLYGGSFVKGTYNWGKLFRVDTNGNYTQLVNFNGTNGGNPWGALIQGVDGNIYGTTVGGGASFTGMSPGGTVNGYGTIFRLTTNGVFTTLFSFGFTNGANPYAGLVQGRDGNFYGVCRNGGVGDSTNGTIFKMTPD